MKVGRVTGDEVVIFEPDSGYRGHPGDGPVYDRVAGYALGTQESY